MSLQQLFDGSGDRLSFDEIIANTLLFFNARLTSRLNGRPPREAIVQAPDSRPRRAPKIVSPPVVPSKVVMRRAPCVFISYSSLDIDIIEALVPFLESRHIRCWYAARDAFKGDDFDIEIMRALEDCEDFLLLLSRHSDASRHVKSEASLWFDSGRPLLPIRLDDTRPRVLRYYLKTAQIATVRTPEEVADLLRARHCRRQEDRGAGRSGHQGTGA